MKSIQRPSLITVDGKRTNAWYDAATVFKEIRNISDAVVQYKNIGAMNHNCTDETPYLEFSSPVENFPTVKQIRCDAPLLIGCFEKKEKEDKTRTALTIVNMSELTAVQTAQVKVKFKGSKVIIWPRGQCEVQTPEADGFYYFTLAPGEGIYVEVED